MKKRNNKKNCERKLLKVKIVTCWEIPVVGDNAAIMILWARGGEGDKICQLKVRKNFFFFKRKS
jgi:hypothetical protein